MKARGGRHGDDGACPLASEPASPWTLCRLVWPGCWSFLMRRVDAGIWGDVGLICWELARSSLKRNESCASLNTGKQYFRVLLQEQEVRYGFGVI